MIKSIFQLIAISVLVSFSATLLAQDEVAGEVSSEVPGEMTAELPDAEATQVQEDTPQPEKVEASPPANDARDIRKRQITGPLKKSETIDLSDTIVGNQEQPTVLYIVPWKDAQDTTILYLPLSSKALEELFGHVDRVEHQRQVQFIEKLDD